MKNEMILNLDEVCEKLGRKINSDSMNGLYVLDIKSSEIGIDFLPVCVIVNGYRWYRQEFGNYEEPGSSGFWGRYESHSDMNKFDYSFEFILYL